MPSIYGIHFWWIIILTNSTSRFTPRRITGSAKSTWSCATDATTTASAAYEILTAAGIKSPTLVNHTPPGKLDCFSLIGSLYILILVAHTYVL